MPGLTVRHPYLFVSRRRTALKPRLVTTTHASAAGDSLRKLPDFVPNRAVQLALLPRQRVCRESHMPDRARVNDIHVSVRLPSDLAEAADEIGELYGVGRSTV